MTWILVIFVNFHHFFHCKFIFFVKFCDFREGKLWFFNVFVIKSCSYHEINFACGAKIDLHKFFDPHSKNPGVLTAIFNQNNSYSQQKLTFQAKLNSFSFKKKNKSFSNSYSFFVLNIKKNFEKFFLCHRNSTSGNFQVRAGPGPIFYRHCRAECGPGPTLILCGPGRAWKVGPADSSNLHVWTFWFCFVCDI